MTKSQHMEKYGLTLRKATAEDRKSADTDYGRSANYVISNGACEWFSANGSLRDMKLFVKEWRNAKI